MAIDVESSLGGCFNVLLHGGEIHVAITIHATRHLHGIAGDGFCEVLVGQVLDQRIVKVVVDGRTNTQFEIRVL